MELHDLGLRITFFKLQQIWENRSCLALQQKFFVSSTGLCTNENKKDQIWHYYFLKQRFYPFSPVVLYLGCRLFRLALYICLVHHKMIFNVYSCTAPCYENTLKMINCCKYFDISKLSLYYRELQFRRKFKLDKS